MLLIGQPALAAVVAPGNGGCSVAPRTAALACSFSAETEVVVAGGTTKPISEVEVGDEVLAVDPETGQRGARQVLNLFVHDDTLVDLGIDGDVVTTTEDHPFWNHTDGAFQRADVLDAGDLVLTADGDLVAVDGLVAGSEQSGPAFNLHIEEIHIYFVVGDEEALVHNSCPNPRNYRDLFFKQIPSTPAGHQVHHALPQKYESIVQRAGINIHENQFLRGVDPTIHPKITTQWQRWERSLGRTPTAQEITNFSYRIYDLEAFTGEVPVWPENTEAFERLRSKLDSPDDVEDLAAVVEEFVHIALHSVLVAVDGGSASAEVGRVTLVDDDGESLGEGLHELFVDHLFDTGRME